MKIKTLMLLAVLFSAVSITRGQSQYMMMTVDATKQGKFKGESLKSGATQKIEVLAYDQEVKSAHDPASGLSTGKRQYQPLTIWKVAGMSSPQFFQALVTNEILRNVTIEFYRPDDIYTKTEVMQYKIELTNAVVANYRQFMGVADGQIFKTSSVGLYDQISFTFEK